MPLLAVTGADFSAVIDALLDSRAHKATLFVSDRQVIRAAFRFKPAGRRREFLLTCGMPNFQERAFIKRCKRRGLPLPQDIQLQPWLKGASRAARSK